MFLDTNYEITTLARQGLQPATQRGRTYGVSVECMDHQRLFPVLADQLVKVVSAHQFPSNGWTLRLMHIPGPDPASLAALDQQSLCASV